MLDARSIGLDPRSRTPAIPIRYLNMGAAAGIYQLLVISEDQPTIKCAARHATASGDAVCSSLPH